LEPIRLFKSENNFSIKFSDVTKSQLSPQAHSH
jgi:hypothetical protein